MPVSINTVLSVSAALGVVLALVLLAARAARMLGFARGGSRRGESAARLILLDTLTLDRVRRLHVVRCDGRDLVVMTGAGPDLFLGWLPGVPPPCRDDPGQEGRP